MDTFKVILFLCYPFSHQIFMHPQPRGECHMCLYNSPLPLITLQHAFLLLHFGQTGFPSGTLESVPYLCLSKFLLENWKGNASALGF